MFFNLFFLPRVSRATPRFKYLNLTYLIKSFLFSDNNTGFSNIKQEYTQKCVKPRPYLVWWNGCFVRKVKNTPACCETFSFRYIHSWGTLFCTPKCIILIKYFMFKPHQKNSLLNQVPGYVPGPSLSRHPKNESTLKNNTVLSTKCLYNTTENS